MTGLPPSDEYDMSDDVPFLAAPDLSLDDALKQAFERRTDIRAAEAEIRAAEHTLAAARDERLPSLTVNGNYGKIGTNPSQVPIRRIMAPPLSMFRSGREAARREKSQRQRPLWLSGKRSSKTRGARWKAMSGMLSSIFERQQVK
jgi:outer membrane protein TolC